MAPLSILPGRVRFEDSRLIGNGALSRYLEAKVSVMTGVTLVTVSHRTGRILVEFCEKHVQREELAEGIGSIFSHELPSAATDDYLKTLPEKTLPLFSSRIFADMALHLLLPAPLDLLVPAVGSALRRGHSVTGTS